MLDLHFQIYLDKEVKSFWLKYVECYWKKAPMGDPNILKYISLAKLVKHQIGEKVQLGGGNTECNLEADNC